MSEVPITRPEGLPERTEREKALWKFQGVTDSELKIVLLGIADGKSVADVVRDNCEVTSSKAEIVRAMHEDPEVVSVYLRARGIQISGFIDNIIESIEEDIPSFGDDKLAQNMWLQNRRLKIDGYSKLIRSARAGIEKCTDDEGQSSGITINITQYSDKKLNDLKTIAVDTVKGIEDGG